MENVRLTTSEIDTILHEAKRVFGSNLACVRLHGSRTDLSKKGGDIDLLIEVRGAGGDKFALTGELRRGLCARLGEQKFDIIIISREPTLNSDRENSFFALVIDKSKILWSPNA